MCKSEIFTQWFLKDINITRKYFALKILGRKLRIHTTPFAVNISTSSTMNVGMFLARK
jgi:hypothetical protein